MRLVPNLIIFSVAFASCVGNSKDISYDGQIQTLPKVETKLPAADIIASPIVSDTLIVDSTVAVFTAPDSLQIETHRKEVGEDKFYAKVYMEIAQDFLDSAKLTILDTKNRKFIKFIGYDNTEQIIGLDSLSELWNIYLFDPTKKMKGIDITNIEEEYYRYFKSTRFNEKNKNSEYAKTILSTTSIEDYKNEAWQMEERYWKYVEKNDTFSYKKLWHRNFIGYPSFGNGVSNKTKIAGWIPELHKDSDLKFSYKLYKKAVNAIGYVVIVFYDADEIWTDMENNVVRKETFKFTHTWKKYDGTWLILGGMAAKKL